MRPTLPAGWQWVPLSRLVSKIEAGKSFKCDERPPVESEHGIVKVSAVTWGTYDEQESKTITDAEKVNEAYLIRPGDFLFSRANTLQLVGACVLVSATRKRLLLSDKILRLVMPDGLKPWLLWFLRSADGRRQIEALSTVNQESMRNIGQERIGQIEVPLPAEPTMQRIVSRIEELFSEIDEGERALQRVGRLVERYRQSVLKAAVTGELTREWRERNPTAAGERLQASISSAHREHVLRASRAGLHADQKGDCLERRLARYEPPAPPQVPSPDWLPETWAWVTVAHMAECLDYARVPVSAKKRDERPGETPYFGANGQVGFIDGVLFDEPLVLVVEDETFTGRIKPFSYLIHGKSWVNNHAHVLRPTSAVDVRYLNAALMRYPLIPLTTGTTARRKLTQKALMTAPLAVPPLEEQLAIVDLLDAQLGSADRAVGEVAGAGPRASALRQSVLKAAFSGQLVAQDPSDEPAAALLARLAAQAAEAPIAPKRGGRPRRQPTTI